MNTTTTTTTTTTSNNNSNTNANTNRATAAAGPEDMRGPERVTAAFPPPLPRTNRDEGKGGADYRHSSTDKADSRDDTHNDVDANVI